MPETWIFGIYLRYLGHKNFSLYRLLWMILFLDFTCFVYSCLLLVPVFGVRKNDLAPFNTAKLDGAIAVNVIHLIL